MALQAPKAAYDTIYDAFVAAGNDSPKDFVIDMAYYAIPSHIKGLAVVDGWGCEVVKNYIYRFAKGATDGNTGWI